MSNYAVAVQTMAWVEADSEEEALENAPEEFKKHFEDDTIELEVVDVDDFE